MIHIVKATRACRFCLFLLCLAFAGTVSYAGEELRIGVPDLPRRVQAELPNLKPEQRIEFGILRLHPSFQTKYEYDDNIKLARDDEHKKGDSLFTQTLGMVAEVDLGNHKFEGGYGAEIVNFVKDQEENAINHMGYGALDLNFGDLTVTLKDLFEKTTSRLFGETSARDRFFINTVDTLARYDRPRWAAETGWRHNTILHSDAIFNANEYNEDILASLAGYKILPKTLLLAEIDLGRVEYYRSGNANQEYWQIFGGVRGEPTDKLTATAKIGFQDRQLGDVPGEGSQTDFGGVVADVDLLYRYSDRESTRLAYKRTVRTSTFADNSWYRADQIYLSHSKRFLRKFVATPLMGWQMNDYEEQAIVGGQTARRRDNFWQAEIELRYEFREWLSAGAAYRFRSRQSNLDTFDFNNSRFIFDLSLAY